MKSQTDKNHQLELSPSEERPSAESPTSRNELELTCGEVEEHQPQGEEQERRRWLSSPAHLALLQNRHQHQAEAGSWELAKAKKSQITLVLLHMGSKLVYNKEKERAV